VNRALFVLALLAPTVALADDVPPIPKELPKAPTSPYVLSGARAAEMNVSIAGSLDANPRTDAPSDARNGRLSTVVGVEVGVPIWNQRLRPSIFAGAQFGYWGDDLHGVASGYFGARMRASVWMGDIWDFYIVGRTDFPMTGAGVAFRPGLGIGVRIARALSFEGTWDFLLPIENDFKNTKETSFVPLAGTLAVSFDLCMSCNKPDPKPVDRNVACRLYNAARTMSTSSTAICAGVPKAMAACPEPMAATREEDGTSTFLDALEQGVSSDAKAAVHRLVQMHVALLQQWDAYESRVASVGIAKRTLAERWTYAPVPAELRSYLGCDGPPPPECVEVTK
jgi:hypothetical protein